MTQGTVVDVGSAIVVGQIAGQGLHRHRVERNDRDTIRLGFGVEAVQLQLGGVVDLPEQTGANALLQTRVLTLAAGRRVVDEPRRPLLTNAGDQTHFVGRQWSVEVAAKAAARAAAVADIEQAATDSKFAPVEIWD